LEEIRLEFIIPIIVGAIIGYITNWLAIKMLFRPYNKKYIFGIKMPFTPGLIPKEKERIAKSVGSAVGEHLLTPEIIAEAMSSESTKANIRKWIEDKYFSLKDTEKTTYELLKMDSSDNNNDILDMISNNLTDYLAKEINNTNFKMKTLEYIDTKIYDKYRDSVFSELRTIGCNYLSEIVLSNEIKMFLRDIIINKYEILKVDERNLINIVPIDKQNTIKEVLDRNKASIGDTVKSIFKDPVVNDKLNRSISDMVNQNMSRVITMFISPDQISEKILQVIEKYIDDPKSNDDYIMLINNVINKLMNNKISDLTNYLEPLITENDVLDIVNKLQGSISRDEILKIMDIIEEKLNESDRKLKEYILNYLSNIIDNIVTSTSFRSSVNKFVKESIRNIFDIPLSILLSRVDENSIDSLINLFMSLFQGFSSTELPRITELFNVADIVEKQINSFEVEYTEELILEIASKELKAITWLGALLGAFMGVLTPLLQNL